MANVNTTTGFVEELFDPFSLHSENNRELDSDSAAQVVDGTLRPTTTGLSSSSDLLYSSRDSKFQSNLDDFDPFGIGATAQQQHSEDSCSTQSPHPPPEVLRLTRSGGVSHVSSSVLVSSGGLPLPPRLIVKLIIHEEVSSVDVGTSESQGASEITVEGSVSALVQSSDALKNSPFALEASAKNQDYKGNLQFSTNRTYVSTPDGPTMQTIVSPCVHIVNIPKSEIAAVALGNYSMSEVIKYMPILVERKVTFQRTLWRLAIQVRSKLSNAGNLKNFTIAVAIPECINGETVKSTRGDGLYDDLKRTIKWKVPELLRGESVMVCAQAQLWASTTDDERDRITFPVMLRCNSDLDQISSVDIRAVEADGFPATVSFSKVHSFRLIHRLL